MLMDFKLQIEISEEDMIRFFRKNGIRVKQVDQKSCESTYHNRTKEQSAKVWVVINPHNRKESPMEDKYRELISEQAKRMLIDGIDKLFVYASFENN